MESIKRRNKLITEAFTNKLGSKKKDEIEFKRAELIDRTFLLNEEFNNMIKSIDEIK